MKKPRRYQRTAALLGAQPQIAPTRIGYAKPKRGGLNIALPRISWKIVLPLALVITLFLWLWLDDRWYLMGENLQILGTSSTGLVREVAMASDLLGWHGLLLRSETATALILENVPGVTAAEVTCYRFPAECRIEVAERVPAMVWATDTVTYWVDQEGNLFPAQSEREDLMRVAGPLPQIDEQKLPAQVQQGVIALVALDIAAEQIEYHPARGLIWVDAAGRRVAFGTGAEMESRWQIYQALIAHLDAKGIFPWTVDVRFPAGPTYAFERSW
jgi:cell division septal protein FtsQ